MKSQKFNYYFRNDFKGIDPYDFFESRVNLPQRIIPKLSFLNKISPINFRPFLGIKPSYNTKSNGLFLNAMINTNIISYETEIKYLISWFINNRATEFEEFSLGFSFKVALSTYESRPGKSSLIISLFVIFAFIEYYKKTKEENILNLIISFESLLEKRWLKKENNQELWYSYLPTEKEEIYNATAKVGKFYALLYSISPSEKYLIKINKILNYLWRVQNKDGSWPYANNIDYVDNFHTAFILDSLFEMNKLVSNQKGEASFALGLKDYISNCFIESRPLHFHINHKPKDIRSKVLKTEIRDSANAIVLFSKIGDCFKAKEILDWTNKNLFNTKRNYYYFYKNNLYTCKINYIRWQAWMAYALSEFQNRCNEKN